MYKFSIAVPLFIIRNFFFSFFHWNRWMKCMFSKKVEFFKFLKISLVCFCIGFFLFIIFLLLFGGWNCIAKFKSNYFWMLGTEQEVYILLHNERCSRVCNGFTVTPSEFFRNSRTLVLIKIPITLNIHVLCSWFCILLYF